MDAQDPPTPNLTGRGPRGAFAPGNKIGAKGRPPNANSLAQTIRREVDQVALVRRMAELAMSQKPAFPKPGEAFVDLMIPPEKSVQAAKWIADNGFTRPPQKVEIETSVATDDAPLTADERAAILRMIAEEERLEAERARLDSGPASSEAH